MSDNEALRGTNAFVGNGGGEDQVRGWEDNIYSNPQDFGLKVVHDHNNGDYDYEIVTVWISLETGVLYWGCDSGNSISTPFEGVCQLSDLEELSTRTLTRFMSTLKEFGVPLEEQIGFRRIAGEVLDLSPGELELYIGLGKSWHGTEDKLIETSIALN
jgi:hypothetical protein